MTECIKEGSSMVKRCSFKGALACSRFQEANQHIDCCAFPSSVGPQQPEALTPRDGHCEAFHGYLRRITILQKT
jgi:hypothetical protein